MRMGIEAAVAPLFEVQPIAWQPPDPARFDAVMLTSANAPRTSELGRYAHLRCFAVGPATAQAAREAGFVELVTSDKDAGALLASMAAAGVRHAFHPCGEDRTPLPAMPMNIEQYPVYRSVAVPHLPQAALRTIEAGAIALIHSPRAGAHFARLVSEARLQRPHTSIVAISEAAAAAVGDGWSKVAVSREPRDHAMLELAARLCNIGDRPGSR
jgi:uroporphyrinogen-III synthase